MRTTHHFQPGERVRIVVEGRLSRARVEMPAQVRHVSRDGRAYLAPVPENTPEECRALAFTGPFHAIGGDKAFGWQDPAFLYHRHFISPEASGA